MTITMSAGRSAGAERTFYLAVIAAMIGCVLLGFARSFFLRPLFPGFAAPPETFFYVHGAVFVGWMALLAVQASLVAADNVAMHMRLGALAYGLVPLMIAIGVVGSFIAARRPGGFFGVSTPPLQFLTTTLGDIAMFAGFAIAALIRRRQPQTHKRLMLLTGIVMMEPTIGRWPFDVIVDWAPAALVLKLVFLIPLALWDIASLRRIHAVTLTGAFVLVSEGLLRDPLGATPQWLAFARWAAGLFG